jgi:hypothetical protein
MSRSVAIQTLPAASGEELVLGRVRTELAGALLRRHGGDQSASLLVKLSRRAESILDGALLFFHEYRPVNRSHCGVRGSGDSDTSVLLASADGYSQHRTRWRRPVRRQPMIVNADASPLGIVRPRIKAALRRLTR